MATVHVTMNNVQGRAITGSTMPVVDSQPTDAATATSSGTSAEVAGIVGAAGKFWQIAVTGGNVWVAFGSNPTAGSGAGHLILDGQTRDFAVTADGEEVAIKDA